MHNTRQSSDQHLATTAIIQQALRTRKDVGTERRHDMWPSIQFPSVSGIDSKLGLTMVKLSLQSTPRPPALDLPCIGKHVCQICSNLWVFWRSVTLTFELKIGTPLTCALGNIYNIVCDCSELHELPSTHPGCVQNNESGFPGLSRTIYVHFPCLFSTV